MTHNYATADSLMSVYASGFLPRVSDTGRVSAGFGRSRHVSHCHGAPIVLSKAGEPLCEKCRNHCTLKSLRYTPPPVEGEVIRMRKRRERYRDGVLVSARDRLYQRTIPTQRITVRETRTVDRDREHRSRVAACWRWIAACRIVEPVPEGSTPERWLFVLQAWGLRRLYGLQRGIEIGASIGGDWSRESVAGAIREGREVVQTRALRRPDHVSTIIGPNEVAAVELARAAMRG